MKRLLVFLSVLISLSLSAQQYSYQLALLKYRGGGDWYANLETSLRNLVDFTNQQLGTNINPEQAIVEADNSDIFNYPFVHMTGHGNVTFNDREVENLRAYLMAGGFLHIDDNYGMDPYIRREMKKVFPELDFVELPDNFPIYHQTFDFNYGLPKIHAHDEKPAAGYGLFWNGRLVCFYSFESDLGDGWESTEVHNDTDEQRIKALRMGSNILEFVFTENNFIE